MWFNKKDGTKMKEIVLILLLLFTPSCAGVTYPRFSAEKTGIDPVFTKHIDSYIKIVGEKHKPRLEYLSMNFAKLEGDTVGRCHWLLNGKIEIEIDTEFWNRYDTTYTDKEFLVYHELEHCIRYRMHTNKKEKIENIVDFFHAIGFFLGIIPEKGHLMDGCPASLMHSHTMSTWCQNKHYNYYINEMKVWKKR